MNSNKEFFVRGLLLTIFFRSTLSHEFYQVMAGQDSFGLTEWRRLMEDSITHSVWNKENPQAPVRKEWEDQYVRFVDGILKEYGNRVPGM